MSWLSIGYLVKPLTSMEIQKSWNQKGRKMGVQAGDQVTNELYKLHACLWSHFSRVWLFVTLLTIACQSPLSVGFSRQEYWSGLPFPSPGDLLTQGSNLGLLRCKQILYCLSYQEEVLLRTTIYVNPSKLMEASSGQCKTAFSFQMDSLPNVILSCIGHLREKICK